MGTDDQLGHARAAGRTLALFARRVEGQDPVSIRLRMAMEITADLLTTCRNPLPIAGINAMIEVFEMALRADAPKE